MHWCTKINNLKKGTSYTNSFYYYAVLKCNKFKPVNESWMEYKGETIQLQFEG